MAIQLFKTLIEKTAYGVCTKIGDKIGISTKRIRLFFIYTSFLTLGSPIIIYMILAFWMNIKNYVKEKRNAVWDL
jgi:phage shock protein PspC (stress-responsive transcriptional regulator)